jgi:hypothetical protein
MACRLTLAVLVAFVSGNINSALGDSGIVVLTDANFERFTTGNDATILVFAYKQNDDFSKQLMPHMEEAAELLAEDGHTGTIGKLDGPSNMASSAKLDLSSFPKVKLYAAGKLWSREFELQAEAAQIVQFMKLHIENAKTKGQKKSGGISSLLRDGVVHSQIEDGEDDKTIDPNPTAAKKGKITSYITQMKEREEKAKLTVFPPGTKPETVYNGLLQVSKELHELAKEATSITGKTGNIAALRGGIKAYNTKVNLIEKRIAKVTPHPCCPPHSRRITKS